LKETRFSQRSGVTISSSSIDNIETSYSEKFDVDLTIKCKHCGFEHTPIYIEKINRALKTRLLIMKVVQTVDRFLPMMSPIMTKLYTIILVT
jgi:hypothetical protein